MHLLHIRHCCYGRGKVFDDHGSSPFHRCANWGHAMGNVSHSDRVAFLLSWPPDDVHRECKRSTTNKHCNRKQKKPAANAQKLRVYISLVRTGSPFLLYIGPVTNCSQYFSCRVLSTITFRDTNSHLPCSSSFTFNIYLR